MSPIFPSLHPENTNTRSSGHNETGGDEWLNYDNTCAGGVITSRPNGGRAIDYYITEINLGYELGPLYNNADADDDADDDDKYIECSTLTHTHTHVHV